LKIEKKNYSELPKKGYSVLNIDDKLRNILLKSIKKQINKVSKVKIKNNFNLINGFKDKDFKKYFGDVSQRFFETKISYKFNNLIKLQFTKNLNLNATMHNPTKSNIKFNKRLTKKDLSFYWRVVRTNKQDVGKPHNDQQFWNLLDKKELNLKFKFKKKLKIWIPLHGTDKNNSLRVLNKKYYNPNKLKKINVNGTIKPDIDKKWFLNNKNNFSKCTDGKKAILFEYKTLHFAPKNMSKNVRLSCEATILIK